MRLLSLLTLLFLLFSCGNRDPFFDSESGDPSFVQKDLLDRSGLKFPSSMKCDCAFALCFQDHLLWLKYEMDNLQLDSLEKLNGLKFRRGEVFYELRKSDKVGDCWKDSLLSRDSALVCEHTDSLSATRDFITHFCLFSLEKKYRLYVFGMDVPKMESGN